MEPNVLESQPAQPVAATSVTPIKKSIFVNYAEQDKIMIDEENWVMIPQKFSWSFSENFQEANAGTDSKKKIIEFVTKAITSWNLVDQDGAIAPITQENVRRIEFKTIMKLVDEINNRIGFDNVPKEGSPQ